MSSEFLCGAGILVLKLQPTRGSISVTRAVPALSAGDRPQSDDDWAGAASLCGFWRQIRGVAFQATQEVAVQLAMRALHRKWSSGPRLRQGVHGSCLLAPSLKTWLLGSCSFSGQPLERSSTQYNR